MADLIVSTLTQGLIYALLSYGVYITYSVLDFPDLTRGQQFPPWGAAVTAILLLQGGEPLGHPAVRRRRRGHRRPVPPALSM